MAYPALHFVEHVVDWIETIMIQKFNNELALVYGEHQDVPGLGLINLQKVEPSAYYKSEAIEPKALPAVFIIADRTIHDLNAQQFALQDHTIYVAVLAEDKEYDQLTRKVWRYSEALYRTLHDAGVGNARLLIEETSYSPTYGKSGDREVRQFRKDVTVRVRAKHFDPWP